MKDLSEEEIKHLFYCGEIRERQIKIGDPRHLDWAMYKMFDLLEKETIFDRQEVEKAFWARIKDLLYYNLK